jgi:hypothetical protein
VTIEEGRTRLKDRFVLSAPTAGYVQRIGLQAGEKVIDHPDDAVSDGTRIRSRK